MDAPVTSQVSSDVAAALGLHGACALLVVDTDGRICHGTPYAWRVLGGALIGEDLASLAAQGECEVISSYLAALSAAPPLTASTYLRCAVTHADGRMLWLQVQGVNALGVPPLDGLVLTLFDISHHVEREHELLQQSRRDVLTGLPNRREFEDQVVAWLDGRRGGVAAMIDVDQFKMVNDRYGHTAGDHVLRILAERMATEAPPGSLVARFGGDEFGMLIPGPGGPMMLKRLDAWRQRVSQPIHVDGVDIPIGLSIGATSLCIDVETVMREGDLALYAAKVRGRSQVAEFSLDAEAIVVGERSYQARLAELKATNDQLAREARTDPLTGLGNARALAECAEKVVGQLRGEWASCSVLFIDIDYFGRYNHCYGDTAGDDALRAVAQCLASSARAGDEVFRKGGEEFVTVLPHTDLHAAIGVGERLRAAVQALGIPHRQGTEDGVVTVSVAVASVAAGERVAEGIRRAGDLAMAQKQAGPRNRVAWDGLSSRAPS